jgi:hypothetical protein
MRLEWEGQASEARLRSQLRVENLVSAVEILSQTRSGGRGMRTTPYPHCRWRSRDLRRHLNKMLVRILQAR